MPKTTAVATATRAAPVVQSAPDTPGTQDIQDNFILVLQGGGALGAYQAGVFEALAACQQQPDWVAGISIGAINAALICGNPPARRVARLREFWDLVSASPALAPLWAATAPARAWANEASANQALLFGVPGFFTPRLPPPTLQPTGTLAAISWYDTTPLRHTLERLVDFDRINAGGTRLSVGAVNVRSGNFAYFDSASQRIDARHILASGALPPGFAPVEIDGEFYWDGGLVSNTPLQYVLDQPCSTQPRTVFQVDLFSARGELPANLDEVGEREKDIRFSSRTRLNTTMELDRQVIAQATQRLLAKLPAALRDDPDARALAALRTEAALDVVHLIYRARHHEGASKDYEFSRRSMHEHWQAGQADMARTLADVRWTQRPRQTQGVRVFDLLRD